MTWASRDRLLPGGLLALAFAGVCAGVCRRQLDAMAAHNLQWAQDLAFFNQILWSASRGGSWTSPLLLEPTGFLEMVHLHPVFALILPVYALWPRPETLLVINAVVVLSAALPLALLGREASGSRWVGAAAGVAFLLWFPTESAAGADFRPMVFFVPAMAWLLYGAFAGRWAPLLAGAALACATREEAGYLVPAFGGVLLVLPFRAWRWRQGLALIAMGGAWFLFLLLFKENFFFHFDPLNPPIYDPPSPELRAARLGWLAKAMLGAFAAAPLAPAPLAMSAGPLGWLMTDAQREWHLATGPYVHLRSPLLPLWAGAGVVGAGLIARLRPRLTPAVVIWLLVGNLLPFYGERRALAEHHAETRALRGSPEVVALNGLVDAVGPDARVATDYRLIAALSGRAVLWNVRHLYLEDGEPPWWTVEWPLTLDRVDTVLVPLDDPITDRLDDAWRLDRQGAGYGLWRRVSPPPGGLPAPIVPIP
ncbi:MAG: DUF2079 domain-containing protein [Alphaproteobacteria bacterium]|nr:DUF2079 domain-containing protein [Alphaproteobacteria bacterium]